MTQKKKPVWLEAGKRKGQKGTVQQRIVNNDHRVEIQRNSTMCCWCKRSCLKSKNACGLGRERAMAARVKSRKSNRTGTPEGWARKNRPRVPREKKSNVIFAGERSAGPSHSAEGRKGKRGMGKRQLPTTKRVARTEGELFKKTIGTKIRSPGHPEGTPTRLSKKGNKGLFRVSSF